MPCTEMGAGCGEGGELTFSLARVETHRWKHLAGSPYVIRGSLERSGTEIEHWELSAYM